MVDRIGDSRQEISPSPSPSARNFTRFSSISKESPTLREMPLKSPNTSSELALGGLRDLMCRLEYENDARKYSEIDQPNNEQEELKALADELAMDTYGKKDVSVYLLGSHPWVNDSPKAFERQANSCGYTIEDLGKLESGENTKAIYTDTTTGKDETIDIKNVKLQEKVNILENRRKEKIARINENEYKLSGRRFEEIYRCKDAEGRVHIAGDLKGLVDVLKEQGLTVTEEELLRLQEVGHTCNATKGDTGANIQLKFISLKETDIKKAREVDDLEERKQKLAVRAWGPEYEGKKLYGFIDTKGELRCYTDETIVLEPGEKPATLYEMNEELDNWHQWRCQEIRKLYQDRTGIKIDPDKFYIHMVNNEQFYITENQELTVADLKKQGVDVPQEYIDNLKKDGKVKLVWEGEGLEKLAELSNKQEVLIKAIAKDIGRTVRLGDGVDVDIDVATLNEVIPFKVSDAGGGGTVNVPRFDNKVQFGYERDGMINLLADRFGIGPDERVDFENALDGLQKAGDSVEYQAPDGQNFKIEFLTRNKAEIDLKEEEYHLELQKKYTERVIELEHRYSTNPDHRNLQGEVLYPYEVKIDTGAMTELKTEIRYYGSQEKAVRALGEDIRGMKEGGEKVLDNDAVGLGKIRSVKYIGLEQRLKDLERKHEVAEKAFNTEAIKEMAVALGHDQIDDVVLNGLENSPLYQFDGKVYKSLHDLATHSMLYDQTSVDELNNKGFTRFNGRRIEALISLDKLRSALEVEQAAVENKRQEFATIAIGPQGKKAFFLYNHTKSQLEVPPYKNIWYFKQKYDISSDNEKNLINGEEFECTQKGTKQKVNFEPFKLYDEVKNMEHYCKKLSAEVKSLYEEVTGGNIEYKDPSGTGELEVVHAHEVKGKLYITGHTGNPELRKEDLRALKDQGVDVPPEHINNLNNLKLDGKVRSVGLEEAVSRLQDKYIAKLAEEVGEGKHAYTISITGGPYAGEEYIRFYKSPKTMAAEWGLLPSERIMIEKPGKSYVDKKKTFKLERLSEEETIKELTVLEAKKGAWDTEEEVENIVKQDLRERLKNEPVYRDPNTGRIYVGDLKNSKYYFPAGTDLSGLELVESKGEENYLREQWIAEQAKKTKFYETNDKRICVANNENEAKRILRTENDVDDVKNRGDGLNRFLEETKAFRKLQKLLKQDRHLSDEPQIIVAYEYTFKEKGKPDVIRTAIGYSREEVEDKLFPENKKYFAKKKTLDDSDVRPMSNERALHWYLYKKVYGRGVDGKEVDEQQICGCKITIHHVDGRIEELGSGIAGSAKEMEGLLKNEGYPLTEDQLKDEDNAAYTLNAKDGSHQVEIKLLEREERIQELEETVAWRMEKIQERHQDLYGKPANPGNIGFMVKIVTENKNAAELQKVSELKKVLGMKSNQNEKFFTTGQLKKLVERYDLLQEYHSAVATLETGDQHALDLLDTKVEITRPGLERTGQELEKARKELNESLAELTDRKSPFSNNPRAYQVVKVHLADSDSNVGEIKQDGIDVVENFQNAQESLNRNFGLNVEGDKKLEDIGIKEEIKFIDNYGNYVIYERISLKDAKNKIEGKKLCNMVKPGLQAYYRQVNQDSLNDLLKPSSILDHKGQAEKRAKKEEEKAILVGTKDIKDINTWKMAYAADVEGKLMFAENERSMRDAFPGKRIEALSPREAKKRLDELIKDERAPQQIKDQRDRIVVHAFEKGLEKVNPKLAQELDAKAAAGDLEVDLQQDNREKYVFEIDHHDKLGNVVNRSYYVCTSLYQASKYLNVSYSTIEQASKAGNELSRYEKAKARFSDKVVPDALKGLTRTVRRIPTNSRRTQQIIKNAGEIVMVSEREQQFYLFKGTGMDGKEKFYISDNKNYQKLGVDLTLVSGPGGIDLDEFPTGVSLAEYVSDDDWWDKTIGKITPGAVLRSPWTAGKGLFTLIMDNRNKDDGEDKKKLLEKPKEEEDDGISTDSTSYLDNASVYGLNYPPISVW